MGGIGPRGQRRAEVDGRRLRPRSVLGRAGLTLALVLFGQAVLTPPQAWAAVALNVTTTADIAANAGDCGSTSTTVPSPLSLREATCIANNYGNTQAVTINVPAGTYTLTSGELQLGKVNGSNITLVGAGSASTIIDGNHGSRVLDLDPNIVGGVTTSISGVTITNGRDSTFGGAGIIDGSGNGTTLDTLNVTNSVITNNQANFAVPTASNKPGGGISFQGGKLTLTNDTFSGNQSFSSAGSAVFYEAPGSATGQTLTVTGSTFSGNSIANSGPSGTSGGALAVGAGAGGGTYTVTNSTFTGNTATSSAGEAAAGAAIFETTGNLTVTGSTFTSNSVSGSGATGGSIVYTAGATTMHYDRFVGNTGTGGVMTNSGTGTADVTEDWWGCNTGPNTAGCETTSGTNITATPRLVLTATASPAHVIGPNGTATLTASLLTDSAGGAVTASNLAPAFNGLPVSFSDPPGDATVTPTAGAHSVNLSGGTASIDYHSNTTFGPDNDLVTLDNATVTDVLEVDEPPTITSANTANFTVGSSGSFTITTVGYPAATITETGSLPSGLAFHGNGDGSATISGTPAAGTGGDYSLSLTAANGYGSNATQTLTVTVGQPPAFTSGATATFQIGQAGSFTVTTSGSPTVSTITESGALPAGATFTDNGDGTATIAGTPNAGSQGVYTIGIRAGNGVAPDATQTFTLTVNAAPQITSADHATFTVNAAAAFTVTTVGQPTPALSETGSLPPGMTFTDNGDGTATLGGTPTAGGSFTFTVTAGNGVLPDATQSFTATVSASPVITSADHTTFAVGSAGSFTVTTTPGTPAATTITESGSLPSGVTFTDNGDGTATLAGTPAAADGGSYPITITAGNGVLPNASQAFTLAVTEVPAITSANHSTFTVGGAGSFTVTTRVGFPAATTLTEAGSLPSGVTFTDNGDGTGTLAGTPAAGTGGSYPLTLTAANSVGHTDQAFTLVVVRQPQTITVTSIPPSPASVGDSYPLSATSDSGLDVAYSIDPATTNSACSLTGSTVSFDAAGSCVVDFDQSGNGTYAPATQVQQTIAVTTVSTAVSVTTSPTSSVYGQEVTATATVTAGSGTPSGTVRFSVDNTNVGSPVAVSGGTAHSPVLTNGGSPFAPGSHKVTAKFTPDDVVTYAKANGSTTYVVDKAATTTTLSVRAHNLHAAVAPVAPGAGTPTGTVRFSVGGRSVGTATLVNGVATLTYTVPAGRANMVAAAYSGDPDFTASSVSTTRGDPDITAQLRSAHPRDRFGWYRSPVTVTFTCTATTAPLTAPCPAPVTLNHGAGRSVTRTIFATDGGTSTVVVSGINIDPTRPRVSIGGVRAGSTYDGAAPRARCVARDRLSGIASCRLAKTVNGTRVTYRATATDRAGNVSRTSITVRILAYYVADAPYRAGAFTVHVGRVYTLVANGTARRPVYFDAAVNPRRPTVRDNAFLRAGHHRWTLGVYMQRALRTHPVWNIGVKVGGTMHIIKIHIG